MDKNIWQILDAEFKNDPHLMGGTVEDTLEIEAVQRQLGLKFPNDYIKFIQKYGGAVIGSDIVYGLRKQKYMGNFMETVDQVTNHYRKQKWPHSRNWVIVSIDSRGNPIGIDPEGKVWLSDHDSGFEQVKLADSFEEFLYKLHTDTLYE